MSEKEPDHTNADNTNAERANAEDTSAERTGAGPAERPEPEPSVLPSGATVAAEGAEAGAKAKSGPSRRSVIAGLGVGAAVVAAGGLGSWWFVRSQGSASAQAGSADALTVTKSWADKEIVIPVPSGVCEAPLVMAVHNNLFKKAGLNVVLKKTGDGENITDAVGSGKYTASNGIFFNFLGPIYNGTPVKLSGGLHHGCLDLYVKNGGPIKAVADLKGKRIGVSDLQGSSTNFFSLDLLDAGINSSPEAKEVEWVVIEQPLLPEALKKGKVDAIATDGGYLPIIQGVKDGWAKEISNNQNLSKNADQPCCAVVLNNDFVSQDPVTAKKLVNAWCEGSRIAGQDLKKTAQVESAGKYVAGKAAEIVPVLKTLTFDPSPKNLKEQLGPGIKKYIKTGFLPANTDAQALADKAFVDLGLNF